jgi:hypothetical protein
MPSLAADAWRYDVVDGAVREGGGKEWPRGRLFVRRRVQEVRGAQGLELEFSAESIGLRLEARIDATSTPLMLVPVELPPDCTIDRVALYEDDLDAPEAVARGAIDLQWSQPTAVRLLAAVQQPRAGRYRLEVDARMTKRPAARGRVPLLRADLAGGTPLAVAWRAAGGDATQPRTVVAEVFPGDPGPEYELAAIMPQAAGVRESTAAGGREQPAAPSIRRQDRVEYAEIVAAVDDRGRIRGIARFDLSVSEPVVRLRLPAAMRLFDVLIDGHEAPVAAVGADTWDIRLHDVAWPRSVMAVFSGDLGRQLAAGEPVQLTAPQLEGLPCRQVIWTLASPEGMAVRVAEPAQPLDQAAWQEVQRSAGKMIADAFAAAVDSSSGPDRERVRAFAAARAAGRHAALESSWEQSLAGTAGLGSTDSVRVAAPATGALTLRMVRLPDATVPDRALATVAVAAGAVVAWALSRRRSAADRPLQRGLWRWGVPFLLLAVGAAWVTLLIPALPGWVFLACGVWLGLARWLGVEAAPQTPPAVRNAAPADIDSASTRTFVAE